MSASNVLVGEGLVSSIVTSIKNHVDANPKMVVSGCRVLSQVIEAKMSEATVDQENAGVAAAQGSSVPKQPKQSAKEAWGEASQEGRQFSATSKQQSVKDAESWLPVQVVSRALLQQ